MITFRYIHKLNSNTLHRTTPLLQTIQWRSYQFWPETVASSIVMPSKIEERELPSIPHTPNKYPEGIVGPVKESRKYLDMRGPERIHNQLIYRQYGLIALGGGAMIGPHFDMIRERVNKYLNFERFFAIWRVDPPAKSVTKRSLGKKMGGGKAKVHHFETPIRAGRVIIEIAGIGQFDECKRILENVSNKMPFYTMPITQAKMDQLLKEKLELDKNNYNPFAFRDLLQRNFSNSQTKISPKEIEWGGTYF